MTKPADRAENDTLAGGIAASAFDVSSPDAETVIASIAPDGDPPAICRDVAALRDAESWGLGQSPAPADRVAALRAELAARKLDGFLIPLADEHQGEFIAPGAQRLAWLTGFGGSAGLAIVCADKAAIFVDGRYTLQVRDQVDIAVFEPHHVTESPPDRWLKDNLSDGMRIGFDPWLHTHSGVERLRKACAAKGSELVAVDTNAVDAVWADRPPPPLGPVLPHGIEQAGVDSAQKRAGIAQTLSDEACDAVVLSAPDSIAWLLNVRGADVANTPLPLSYAIVRADASVEWFIDERKLTKAARDHLGDGVSVSAPGDLGARLDALGAEKAMVRLDPGVAPEWIRTRLEAAGAQISAGADPCVLPKAKKNEAELAGTRACHVRDGAALSEFLAWLSTAAPAGGVTEMSAADRLFAFRQADADFRGGSFDTISGAGPNGAIVHYRVTEQTDRPLSPGDVYLVDSGGQYLDGTTDVTRTVYVANGDPAPAETRDRFTRVLKGHIALATARFPAGTTGSQIDALARLPLWGAGIDYDHGTGHGVGSYLGVHEGPQRISKLAGSIALEPGMILSNEPGYYKTGEYGIRIENLVVVIPSEAEDGAERDMLSFETITLAPIDRALIEPGLLSTDERAWLDSYHARVRETLSPLVSETTRDWLEAATAAI